MDFYTSPSQTSCYYSQSANLKYLRIVLMNQNLPCFALEISQLDNKICMILCIKWWDSDRFL